MFDFISSAIENGIDIVGDLVDGELPTSSQVSKLIIDGATVASIANATGFSVAVIESLIED